MLVSNISPRPAVISLSREGKRFLENADRVLWMHDKAAAEATAFPEPDEIKDDIATLVRWVKSIRDRR